MSLYLLRRQEALKAPHGKLSGYVKLAAGLYANTKPRFFPQCHRPTLTREAKRNTIASQVQELKQMSLTNKRDFFA